MVKLLWRFWLAVPAALGAAVAVAGGAIATESASSTPVGHGDPASVQLAQITSVSDLTDVQPSDWAFQALQSLVENYGCIQGYPDRTFRGQRPLTRFEFAAGLNACLDVLATLIAQAGINPDDLEAIRRLQAEFQAELATLRGRVDALEAETATLRAQQFSTTTKLRGQADFHIITPFDTIPGQTSTSVAARARLNFDSSFTGRDRLRIRLQAADGNAITPLYGLAAAAGGGYDVIIDDFFYKFPVGERINITLAARGLQGDDWVTSTIVPFDGPSVADAGGPGFYRFGGSNSNGAGAGVSIAFTDNLILDTGYTAGYGGASDPAVGIFAAANQSYIAQISYISDGFLDAAFAYLHNDQSIIFGGLPGGTDTFAGLLNLDFGNFFIAGHGAWQSFNGGNDFSWTAGAGLKDILVDGSQLAVYGGQLPQLAAYSNNPVLVEGYWQVPVNRFLTITPALIYGNANLTGATDNTGFWGAVRATFRY